MTADDAYRAILQHEPYRLAGLVAFGANLVVANANSRRGREALRALEFSVHIDLFMNPTAELADVVLPATSAFESEGLKIGFEVTQAAQAHLQLRPRVASPRGEARSDTEIVFGLAVALGLGEQFWNGDVDAGWRHQLAPSGVTLDALRHNPGGVRLPLATAHRKFAEPYGGVPRGFATPSKKIELHSTVLEAHGHPPLPDYEPTSARSHANRRSVAPAGGADECGVF